MRSVQFAIVVAICLMHGTVNWATLLYLWCLVCLLSGQPAGNAAVVVRMSARCNGKADGDHHTRKVSIELAIPLPGHTERVSALRLDITVFSPSGEFRGVF